MTLADVVADLDLADVTRDFGEVQSTVALTSPDPILRLIPPTKSPRYSSVQRSA